jgi:1-acyl-sn-glycerol-3-phosphate acyltransferase
MGRVGVVDGLRSVLFAIWFWVVSVGLGLLNPVLTRLPSPRWAIANAENWSGALRWGVEHILGTPVVVEGHFPDEPVLIAIKHESMFEALDLPTLLNRPGIFAKVELLKLPSWGRAGMRYGLVPVERDQGAKALRAMLSAARAMVAANRPLAIFPEGTRVPHGQRPPLQSGFAGIYKMVGLPVVPVAVNSGALLRGFWKKRGVVTYRIGETIPPGLPRDEMEARVHAAINALNSPQ